MPIPKSDLKAATLLAGIREANYHAGGIRCLQRFWLQEKYFAELCADVERLCRTERASDVTNPNHITNWTKPRGKVLQFSLLNATGRYDDFSIDHNLSCLGKQFHGGAVYPVLRRFIAALPDTLNFRINVMGAGAELSPHEEHAIFRTQSGSVGARLRFHLPIVTNSGGELMLDGSVYHLTTGTIYFVNHGCVHASRNRGREHRIHLVWDSLLTRNTFECMFGETSLPLPLAAIDESEQSLAPVRTERVGAHIRLPPLVSRDEAESLDWCKIQ